MYFHDSDAHTISYRVVTVNWIPCIQNICVVTYKKVARHSQTENLF